jgi:hypothetical protein
MAEKEPPFDPDRKPRFNLGRVVGTPGALEAFSQAGQDPLALLGRHVTGDWGEVPDEDKAENEFSVNNNLRIMSAYTLSNGVQVWVVTEADRSATTILLPDEY